MIINVALNLDGLQKARATEALPDFTRIFNSFADVKLVDVSGRGRSAQFEMTEDTYRKIREDFGHKFNFSRERALEPFQH